MTKTKKYNGLNFGHLTWRSYGTIKKKAMEQEFSWSGLLISLSIAFFIVLLWAQILSLAYKSISKNDNWPKFIYGGGKSFTAQSCIISEKEEDNLSKGSSMLNKKNYLPQLHLA